MKEILENEKKIIESLDKPVIGYFCSYTPVEIIHAAGFHPYRVFGVDESAKRADGFMHSNICPYVLSCLDSALDGDLDFLKGAVFINSCDAMRRLYEVYRMQIKTEFTYFMDLPKKNDEQDVLYFQNEIRDFVKKLNQYIRSLPDSTGESAITDVSIDNSISTYKKMRNLLKRLHLLRKQSSISASDYIKIVNGSVTLPVEMFTDELEKYINDLESAQTAHIDKSPRLLLMGNIAHHPEIFELIEESGARIVADFLCTGLRSYDINVLDGDNQIQRLAHAYLNKPACARMIDEKRELDFILNLIREFKIEGVLYHSLKFCDVYLESIPRMKRFFNDNNVKSLFLEGDYTTGSMGQMQTRIEAFVEML